MRHLERIIESVTKKLFPVLAGIALLAILLSLLLALWVSTKPNIASIGRQVCFFDISCLAVGLTSFMIRAHIRKHGLGRTLRIGLLAAAVSLALVVVTALGGKETFKFTAIPENLKYSWMLWRGAPQYSVWAEPAVSANVERWHLTQYGFPEAFWEECEGLTVEGHYTMVDWFRLVFDWILAFTVSLAIMKGSKILADSIKTRLNSR